MKLKQIASLVIGLLPLGVVAQTNQPQNAAVTAPATAVPVAAASRAPAPQVTASVMTPPQLPEKGKLSYCVGMFFASSITNATKKGSLDIDNEVLLGAIRDVVDGKPTKYTTKEVSEVLTELRSAMQAKRRIEDEATKAKNDAFFTQFGQRPGVISTNGVEYKVITDGAGPTVKESDSLVVAYRGTLVDGTEFDHNDNFSVNQNGVIPGWRKVLPLMKAGSKWQVVIPPTLGYGPRGSQKIPGNSVLIFDIEVKSITPGAPTLPRVSSSLSLPPHAAQPVNSHPLTNLSTPPAPPNSAVTVSGEIIKVPSQEDMKKGAKIEVIKDGQTNAINSDAQTNAANSH
jgi:FKBP-type peptidyl-prolyl cis-trans isomerase